MSSMHRGNPLEIRRLNSLTVYGDRARPSMSCGSSFSILLKNPPVHLDNLRRNGGETEIVGEFPFMLSPVEAFLGFFQQNRFP